MMMTEAYLELADLVKYYGAGRDVAPEDDDLVPISCFLKYFRQKN
jgi:hypothetical protein